MHVTRRAAPSSPQAPFLRSGSVLLSLCDRWAQPGTSRAWPLCISGPPGTGKSEFVHYLAGPLDLDVFRKRASDLLSMWLDGTKKAVAAAFREVQESGALFSDRRNRGDAIRP
jgi:hypothetical protein